jgi:hypothetical protein
MTDEQGPGEGAIYHIRVRGDRRCATLLQDSVGEEQADPFDGFVLVPRDSGEILLTGPVADQAALHRVLAGLRDAGLNLVFVARVDCPCPKRKCPRHGHCQECAAYHSAKGGLSYCFREGNRWDRRCAAFAKSI